MVSQGGHAYLDSYLNNPDTEYLNNPTKICLGANEEELEKVCSQCEHYGVPYVKVIDPDFTVLDNRVVFNDGTMPPAFTAVGIGVVTKQDVKKILSNLKLL